METIQTNSIFQPKKVHVPLTAKLKEVILNNQGKIGAGAGLIAGTIFVSGRYFSPILETEPAPAAEVCPVSENEICDTPGTYIGTNVGSGLISSTDPAMNFEDTFAQHRELQGPGGIFEYNDKMYNTYFKEEWESMSKSEKDAYYAQVNDKLEEGASTILVSDGHGNVTTLTFDQQEIMNVHVIDTDSDGIVDVAAIDINFDGVTDYNFQIEKVVVQADEITNSATDTFIIDDNADHPDFIHSMVDVDAEDITLISDVNVTPIEKQNVFNDPDIHHTELPEIIDDMDMSEF